MVVPLDALITKEPALLSPRELSRVVDGALPSLLFAALTGKEIQHRSVSEGSSGSRGIPKSGRFESTDFIDEAVVPHDIHSILNAAIEAVSIHVNAESVHRINIFRHRQVSDERLSRQFDDLEGPHDPPSIVPFDGLRRIRVYGVKLIVKCRSAYFTQSSLPACSDVSIRTGKIEFLQNRTDVQSTAANNEGSRASSSDIVDRLTCPVTELHDAHGLVDRPDVDHVVADQPLVCLVRFGGADIHAAVCLH